jgi:hypothetical protein
LLIIVVIGAIGVDGLEAQRIEVETLYELKPNEFLA